ncbi:hypothetical protein FLAG1_08571 [Fusarium langsethiae]|uniref:Mg2+ transporter protein, CorA-like/Zinc transport protein ZntB n=1 Tax=Fusarium langsethiae TaxID=179993 RepID=A0A0M9ERS7_FUSLA|nr:hypothetical protein FLAG1_08571 [Fusarium langsethiae]GKU05681.1 unnamed protein product [Fusarium langsethiae]GKU21545.1 unnamed protein product [Fusarium langsethiae]
MFNRKRRDLTDEERPSGYDLDWPASQRWKPNYSVPRNSLDERKTSRTSLGLDKETSIERPHHVPHPLSFGRNRRDMDTFADIRQSNEEDADEEEFSDPKLWIETISELYMNELDNRARWDPRWLNVTRRERFEGLESVTVSVIDYLANGQVERSDLITTKKDLAAATNTRPEESQVRVVMVSDLSRFVMGALGQLYSIDPEFWYEQLITSGYSASDSGLKLRNAVWMNWNEGETHFRHRPLPGIGQRTEWNLARRTKSRNWAHLRWGRLGALHYLGRPGFHEDEISGRISDGRWTIERDVVVDRSGLLLTDKRKKRAKKKIQERKEKEEKKETKKRNKNMLAVPEPPKSTVKIEGTSNRVKASNVYRPYTTFFPILRQNPEYWKNRDLRVMAPEGMGYWTSVDKDGKKIVVLTFDPPRTMQNEKSKETTPSLTFMPRAMEFESYTDEELWRTADPGETYLDPPSFTKKKPGEREKPKKRRLEEEEDKMGDTLASAGINKEDGTDFIDASDSEYDEEYQNNIRKIYKSRQSWVRDRDFARKYSLSTMDLVSRYVSNIPPKELLQDDSAIPSLLTRLSFDDMWQLLAELRIVQDHIDSDLGADLHLHLLQDAGTATRQNMAWIRSTLQEMGEWVDNLKKSKKILNLPEDVEQEMIELQEDLQSLRTRSEQTLNFLVASTGISQSALVIDQTSGINKLTELAFFFVPLSFITAVFSMQVAELNDAPPKMWTWGLSLGVVFVITYAIRIFLRSPTVRYCVKAGRITILNRFTPKSRSMSLRLDSISNRAIAKFFFFLITTVLLVLIIIVIYVLSGFLFFFGLWAGIAGTALYFIITRWPEAAVLASCFVSLVISGIGLTTVWYWSDVLVDVWTIWIDNAMNWVTNLWPEDWTTDSVDDEDLDREGVPTYARQGIFLPSK